MNRKELDAFVTHYKLPATSTDIALDVAGARPTPSEFRQFLVRLLQLAGVLSLAAGVVFFVAANWLYVGVTGRFVLIQGAVVVGVALALWKPAPQALGRYALLMAFIATGALLALFGQVYQTGADVYELFLTWSLLGLTFVVAGQWSVLSATWLVVFNVALLLLCSGQTRGGMALWLPEGEALRLLVPAMLNLALWFIAELGRRARWDAFAQRWVASLMLVGAFGFMTWAAGLVVLSTSDSGLARIAGQSSGDSVALLAVLALEAGLVLYVMRIRNDVFPLALTAASLIALGALALGVHAGSGEETAFILALWLVVTSTLSGRVLMSLVRAWGSKEDTV